MEVDASASSGGAAPSPVDLLLKDGVANTPVEGLEKMITKHPGLKEQLQTALQLFADRLYHELTDAYAAILTAAASRLPVPIHRAEFFQLCVAPVKAKISPLRLGKLLKIAVEALEASEATKLLDSYDQVFKKNCEANLLFLITRAQHLTRGKDYAACEALLEKVKEVMEANPGLDLDVYANYHKAAGMLYKEQNKYTEFYSHAMIYLAYTPLASISELERDDMAVQVATAAIVSEDCYNFGEMLQQPLTSTYLKNSATHGWLYDLLSAFHEGKFEMFDAVLEKHKQQIDQADLGKHPDIMRRKITLLALLELAFRTPKKERVLSFADIAEHCRVPLKEVELLVMRAMSLQLLVGLVDQVQQVVRISWVKPRLLDAPRCVCSQKSPPKKASNRPSAN
eukprot:GHVT01097089.1.p1 GENE.GHVT01097089.1~~GHVT01097089.1.p1  ORF type:complete len:397 (-),score=119.27 GHVT01097089.1:2194-3384(-)